MARSGSIMALMVMAVLVVAVVHPAAWAQQCTSTNGAPKVSDVNNCLTYLRNIGSNKCCQQNSPKGACTSMATSGGAIVDICGTANGCTTCATAADGLATIANKCCHTYGGVKRVSGTTSYAGFTFRIRHT